MKRGWLGALPLLAACAHGPAPTTAPTVTPPAHLTARAFSDLPGWTAGRMDDALVAFKRGCVVLAAKPDDTPMGAYAGTVADWRGPCADASGDARAFFETRFTPYEISGPARFTGYYEPQITASRTRQGGFTAPVYGLPPDLVRADLSLFGSQWRGEHISGRLEGHAVKPYPDRAAIDADGAPGAPVLLYADPIDLFFLQIQGSGRVALEDGSLVRLSYAGENGQPYTAIGRTLMAEGTLALKDVSLGSIRAWLTAHPDQARRVMETNKSYVFFQAAPLADAALGPNGTLGVALAPLADMAVDARIHALGAPFFVAATGPDPVQAVLIGADTGGAIRGAARGDVFFGSGAAAEQRAGAMNAGGRMFVLLPKAVAARLGPDKALTP
jgi:membrane-bound lytic murein transglycosylase A